jgi:hypothetical protein
MKTVVIGIDPSFTACGISDGERHEIIKTIPNDAQNAVDNLRRRSIEVCEGIIDFVGDRHVHLFIEAAMLTAHGDGAHHLYELGWLMNDIHHLVPSEIVGGVFSIHEVPSATLRRWSTGNGNTAKAEMKLRVFRNFGVEFERDPGCDKLFAYLLARYGRALLMGEITHEAPKRRGAGKTASAHKKTRDRKKVNDRKKAS